MNLENLKKQAKQILRWHRERYHPVAAQIRIALPRFRQLDDAAILAASFKLSDAQEVVARQSGFESWSALKAGASTMTNRSDDSGRKPVLSGAEPQLFVRDFANATAFFERLGFAVAFAYGDPPFYGQVVRDAARLNLRCVAAPVFDDDLRQREVLLSAAITVDGDGEIKRLFLEFQAAGVAFHQGLRTEPWGARTFILRDPDGNLLLFAGPAEQPS